MEQMIRIGEAAPDFHLKGIDQGKVRTYTLKEFKKRWIVLFFYPADFTFVCPTEVLGFNTHLEAFAQLEAQVLGVSIDSIESHRAWAEELGGVRYPLLSDADKELSRTYNVLDPEEGVALRATFLMDPQAKLQYSVISPFNVGRSVEETLRVLQALRTGRLCPADWHPNDPTLEPHLKF